MATRSKGFWLKLTASIVVIGGGIGFLFYDSFGEALEYYRHVDEVMNETAKWQGKRLQIHGFVSPGSIMRRLDREHQQVEYKFIAVNCGKQVEVHYAGTVPDTFKDRAEVVVKGTLTQDRFEAKEISAKCPSKYEQTSRSPSQTLCARGNAPEGGGAS